MPPKKSGIGTRANSDNFFIGQEQCDLGPEARQGKLPLTRNVLAHLFHVKNLPGYKYQSIAKVICCPMKAHTKMAICEENTECKCVVNRVKTEGNLSASGIPLKSD